MSEPHRPQEENAARGPTGSAQAGIWPPPRPTSAGWWTWAPRNPGFTFPICAQHSSGPGASWKKAARYNREALALCRAIMSSIQRNLAPDPSADPGTARGSQGDSRCSPLRADPAEKLSDLDSRYDRRASDTTTRDARPAVWNPVRDLVRAASRSQLFLHSSGSTDKRGDPERGSKLFLADLNQEPRLSGSGAAGMAVSKMNGAWVLGD
jgi:hypothetical protein